jgi:hypothetical protein
MDLFKDLGQPSTTWAHEDAKIKRPRRVRPGRRRKATAPQLASVYGPRTPVQLRLVAYRGPEAWVEVTSCGGRWFVNWDAGVGDLLTQIIKGGHWVEEIGRPSTT